MRERRKEGREREKERKTDRKKVSFLDSQPCGRLGDGEKFGE
jgi:hypothetical protein